MKFPTYKEIGEKAGNYALDEFLVNDKSLREWIGLMSEGMIPMSVIEDIKAEIFEELKNDEGGNYGLGLALGIIDKHISGKE